MGMAAAIQRRLRAWPEAGDFGALVPTLRDGIARDARIPTGTLDRIMEGGAASGDELPRLLTAVGLEPLAVRRAQPAVLRDMQVVCSGCSEAARCRRLLDRGVARAVFGSYCPNAPTIEALRAVNGADLG